MWKIISNFLVELPIFHVPKSKFSQKDRDEKTIFPGCFAFYMLLPVIHIYLITTFSLGTQRRTGTSRKWLFAVWWHFHFEAGWGSTKIRNLSEKWNDFFALLDCSYWKMDEICCECCKVGKENVPPLCALIPSSLSIEHLRLIEWHFSFLTWKNSGPSKQRYCLHVLS